MVGRMDILIVHRLGAMRLEIFLRDVIHIIQKVELGILSIAR